MKNPLINFWLVTRAGGGLPWDGAPRHAHHPTLSVIGAHYAGVPAPAPALVFTHQSWREVGGGGDHPQPQPWATRRVLPQADGSRHCEGNHRNFAHREGVCARALQISTFECVNMSGNRNTTLRETSKLWAVTCFERKQKLYFFLC